MSIDQVPTLAALKAIYSSSSSISGEVRFMEGRAAAGDPGAGIFEWVASRTDTPNDADVVLPSSYSASSSGRWIRQVDVRGPVHVEWFGAKGDGTTDDRAHIQACLNYFGRVTLLAKEYRIDTHLLLRTDFIVEGQGMGLTTLKFTDDSAGKSLVAFKNQSGYDAHNAVIRDLTVDCGGGAGAGDSAYQAIRLTGENLLIERVEAKNFRACLSNDPDDPDFSDYPDCLVIGLQNSGDTTRMGIIRECVVQSQAENETGTLTTITCLSLLGQTAPSGSYPGRGGAVLRNRVLGLEHTGPSSDHLSQLRGIVFGRSIGVEVAENELVGFDGAAIISTDVSEHDSVIRANRLLNVQAGIVIGANSGTVEHLRGRVFDNLITIAVVGGYSEVGTHGLVGVRFIDAGTQVAGDCWIQRNYIQGSTQGYTVPLGIDLQRESSAGKPVVVEDNIIETKDHQTSGGLGVDYENSVVVAYSDDRGDALDLKKVEVHGNRKISRGWTYA